MELSNQSAEYLEQFEEEQQHLDGAYTKLQAIRSQAEQDLASLSNDAGKDFAQMKDELFLGSADADQLLEMQIEYEYVNQLIDQFNLSYDMNAEQLSKALRLLKRPYFAKITLQFKPGAAPKEVYIGEVGMTDDDYKHFIVDWRSPVAEVYYNQENGHTSYEANGRIIECDLKLRRQFDIEGSSLKSFFDTTVAIQDGLLLEALMKQRSDKMGAITTTIQREQNQVIRHPDVPVLLVSGIAGSGKTSVLLQRIAYLFYHNRENLRPDQVYLLTPNPVFRTYIDSVLPEMGETNPQMITYGELCERMGCANKAKDTKVGLAEMLALEKAACAYIFDQSDFCDIRIDDEVVISLNQIRRSFTRRSKMPSKHGMVELMIDDLFAQLEGRIKNRSKTEEAQGEMLDLSTSEQIRIFGSKIYPHTEEEFIEYAETYLRDRYKGIKARIEAAEWIRFDRIGAHLTGNSSLSKAQWAHLKVCLTGICARDARYVLIDEVQDYTQAQLLMLSAYFPHAHFLLLGDENQALRAGTANFKQVGEVFKLKQGTIDECSLMTSYRSSPEITALFSRFMDADERIKVQSVQRPGMIPFIKSYEDEEDYWTALSQMAKSAQAQGGLTALIAADSYQAQRVYQGLVKRGIEPLLMDEQHVMPKSGLLVLTVKTAKGLEFDEVIIPDAYVQNYPDNLLSRHKLYTAISRATRKLSIISRGEITSLLQGEEV